MEAAVPPYTSDVAASAAAVGELYLYVRQLSARCGQLADQANRLDDERLEAKAQITRLAAELASAHTHNDELRAQLTLQLADGDCCSEGPCSCH